jgi:two-component system response regulator PilR (NtrC family)
LEAEFFGAKKGSFTGATQDREGFFQAARGGTLFLDEIGDLPLAMQSKLLRAIQERSVRAIGATQEEAVDARIISATHKDLAAEVEAGRFRQDLFYRLNVIEIKLPPLRERLEDLPALCAALLNRIADEAGMDVPVLSSMLLEQVSRHPLRGNVRELENLLHRAVALGDTGQLQIEAPGSPSPQYQSESARPAAVITQRDTIPRDLQHHLDQQEREILISALEEAGYNRTAAASRLGLSLRQMRYRIDRLKIEMPQGSEAADDARQSG